MNLIPKRTFQFTTQDGSHVYGESRGQGPTLILVYGIACQMNHWVHQIQYLSKYFEVITYDLRGHAKSTVGDASKLTIQGLSDDLFELMDFLELPSAHFAGHSFGVPILLEFAAKFPERARSLSLINGFATNPMENFFGINISKFVLPTFIGLNQEDPQALQKLWAKFVDNPLAILVTGASGGFNLDVTQLKDIEIYTRGVAHMDLNVFVPLFESLVQYDGRSSCHKIQCPTLIVGGDRDRVTPLRFQAELHRLILKSQLVTIPYGSHCCQLDFPDYVNLLIKRQIDENHLNLLA
jgi:pimeloyl-ACP methyl ester carboxylesterase